MNQTYQTEMNSKQNMQKYTARTKHRALRNREIEQQQSCSESREVEQQQSHSESREIEQHQSYSESRETEKQQSIARAGK